MKKLLAITSIAAMAATAGFAGNYSQQPTIAPAAPAPQAFNWTGAYAGVQLGYMSGSHRWSFPSLGDQYFRPKPSGMIGGVYGGYNWQGAGNMVFGVEAEFNTSRARGSDDYRLANGALANPAGNVVGHSRIRSTAALTARAGMAMDRTLFFVAAGVSHASYRLSWDLFGAEQDSVKGTRTGWTVGIGVEHALQAGWNLRADLRHSNFGTASFGALPGGTVPSRAKLRTTEARIGIAYRF